jgi:hypothetical protein
MGLWPGARAHFLRWPWLSTAASLLFLLPPPASSAPAAAARRRGHPPRPEDSRRIGGGSPRWRDVHLTVLFPREGQVVKPGKAFVKLRLRGYRLPGKAPAPGEEAPHLQIVVDNAAYKPVYDARAPFDLGELPEGPHTLRVFPARPWHESLKSCARICFRTVRFWVGAKGGKADWFDPRQPLITWSRPKGEYQGEQARRILLDFYLTGTRLSPTGNQVKFLLDGKEQDPFTRWMPRWIEGLSPGEHSFKLILVNAKGEPLQNGGGNLLERRIAVK